MPYLKLRHPRKSEFIEEDTGVCVLCGGRKAPKSQLLTREGKTYCKAHYRFRYHHRDLDNQKLDLEETNE